MKNIGIITDSHSGISQDDAKKLGAGRIFVNIDDEDYKLYKSLGYIEIPKIFNSRVIRFDGAIVTFDKTMLKLL